MEAAAPKAQTARLADSRLAGPLRITAGDGFAEHVVLPSLVDFRRAHPDVTIEIVADTRVLDLSRREADVAVRWTMCRK